MTKLVEQRELVDSAGIPIEFGQRVAFNRSGNVLLGRVWGLQVRWKTYQYQPGKFYFTGYIAIKADLDGKVSMVKNPGSVAVLP